jgi:hypothetical protein
LGGTDYNDSYQDCVYTSYLQVKDVTLYVYYFTEEETNSIVRAGKDVTTAAVYSRNYTTTLTKDTKEFSIDLTNNLETPELKTLQSLQKSVNFEPYLYLSFDSNTKKLIKSTKVEIDKENKVVAYFNFDKNMSANQPIYIYWEEIKEDWIETNLGHVDYSNLKW